VPETAIEVEALQLFTPTPDRVRIHWNEVPVRVVYSDLLMPHSFVRSFESVSANTSIPLEYAFHLLGDLTGKTVVDLGAGDGRNAVLLALLGARVFAVDVADSDLKLVSRRAAVNGVGERVGVVHRSAESIPVADASIDRVICTETLQEADYLRTGRQIRRILKPGGTAAFIQVVPGSGWRRFLGRNSDSLRTSQCQAASRAVGRPGRSRRFGSMLVWEAIKER
jgi:SAM-dependent methyltransferase